MYTLQELSQASQKEHPYYCSNNNWHNADAAAEYETWADFYQEYYDADPDMNLIFRFDIESYNSYEGLYKMYIYIIQQKRGYFKPISIKIVTESDGPQVNELLSKHHELLIKLWQPFSKLHTDKP